VEQFKALTVEQRQAIEAVAEYLTGSTIWEDNLADEEISRTFNLLKVSRGCVPIEEADENLLKTIRKKFGAVYQVGMELADADLKARKTTGFNFCFMADSSYEDTTHLGIVDYDRAICYLHEGTKAWHLGFNCLAELAEAVLKVKKCLVEKVAAFSTKEIFVVMEGGGVHEILNLPPNINVTVIDYDTEDVEKERLEISPVDGELCVINKW
jgi:hypothetical protein